MKHTRTIIAVIIAAAGIGTVTEPTLPSAFAAPAPEVEYLYNVTVRRHYNFADANDAVNYGHGICDKVSRGDGYARVMSDVKTEMASDEFSANFLISYAVNLLCPAQIWQLRNSAASYRPSEG
jgi:hypothetical protein